MPEQTCSVLLQSLSLNCDYPFAPQETRKDGDRARDRTLQSRLFDLPYRARQFGNILHGLDQSRTMPARNFRSERTR